MPFVRPFLAQRRPATAVQQPGLMAALAAVTMLAVACAPLPDTGAPALPASLQTGANAPRLIPLGPALAAAESGTLSDDTAAALAGRAAALRARGAALRNASTDG